MSAIFIDDGFTQTHQMPAAPGKHPAVELVYRPAPGKERHAYQAKLRTENADAIDQYENDLLFRHTVTVAGAELKDKERARRLHPDIRVRLIDLILSYTPATVAEVEGKSSGACA